MKRIIITESQMNALLEAMGGAYLDLQSGDNVDDAATNKEVFVNDPDTTYKDRNTTTDAFLQKRMSGRSGMFKASTRGANACYEDINESDEINDKTYNYGKNTKQRMSQLAGQGEMYNSIANGEEVTADNLYVRRNRLKQRVKNNPMDMAAKTALKGTDSRLKQAQGEAQNMRDAKKDAGLPTRKKPTFNPNGPQKGNSHSKSDANVYYFK